MIVKAQDLQASYCKFINVTLPNNLTKPGFPDIADLDDETVWEKGTVLVTGESVLPGLRESKMSKRRIIKVRYFPGARICDMFFYLVPLLHKKPCSAPICNLCLDLKSLLPRFEISLPRFEIPVPICNLFALI